MITQRLRHTDSTDLTVIPGRTGKPTLRVRGEDGIERTLHSLYNPEKEAESIVDSFQYDGDEIIVILGLGLGYHVKELVKRYPDAEIIVVEAREEIYRACREYGICPEILNRVIFIVGDSPEKAMERIMIRQLKCGMKPLSLLPLPSALNAFPGYYRPLYSTLKNRATRRLKERLIYTKLQKERLRICLLDFGYFLKKEILNAIKTLGHDVVSISGNREEKVGRLLGRVVKTIIDSRPDFILAINHMGFDEEGILASFLSSIEMPVAVWYVDSPNIIVRAYRRNVSDNTVIFLWDHSYIDDMRAAGFKHVYYLPLATDRSIFRPLRLSKKAYRKHHSRVSFVGNSMLDACRKQAGKIPHGFHDIMESLAETLSRERMSFEKLCSSYDEGTTEKLDQLTEKDLRELEAAIYWKATLINRLRAINRLREFTPVIYGDSGWRELLDEAFEIRGKVDYYQGLPVVYNSTDVNFNTTSLQMPEAVNQRVFDVPACGSFLITDYQKALEELFEPGREVITYEDPEEIPELVRYYLDHPRERQRVALAARRRVLAEHTYLHRLQRIVEIMRRIFS